MLRFEKILCPVDFSESSFNALEKARMLALDGSSEILLLHVVPFPAPNNKGFGSEEEAEKYQRQESEARLRRVVQEHLSPLENVRTLVRFGSPAGVVIVDTARQEVADLIIMGTHGLTGWRRFVLGSVAEEVVRLAPCPVLTIGGAMLNKTKAETAKTGDTLKKSGDTEIATDAIAAREYSVDESDFPCTGSSETKLRFLLNYAVLAPSNRNTQPWRWRFNGEALELYADRMRALPHTDPDDRELTLSCGAALFYLRVAIRHFGYIGEVELLPHKDDPDMLARVQLGDELAASGEDELLFAAIAHRHTNREPFLERELPEELVAALKDAARVEGASLSVIENVETRMAIINLIAKSDQAQGHDPQFLQETANWIRPNRVPSSDGIPQHALGGGGMLSRFATDAGAAQGDKDRLLAWSAPVMAVLETKDDSPRDWIVAGQALARVLLRASAEGVQASFFNSPVEVIESWPELHHILHSIGLPQIIVRLGYPSKETGHTPRRTVSEVLDVSEL